MNRNWDVLIIGGASGTGKTTISRSLAKHFKVDFVRVDDFQVFSQAMLPAESFPQIHYPQELREKEAEASAQWLIDVGRVFAPGLKAVVDDHICENIPMILEGDFILPELSAALQSEKVKSVFIYEAGEDQILQNYLSREGELQPRRAEISYLHNKWLVENCLRYGITAIEARPWDSLMERIINKLQLTHSLIVAVMIIVLLSGCLSRNERSVISGGHGIPSFGNASNIEELHEALLLARTFSRGENPWAAMDAATQVERQREAGFWNLGDTEYYFIPSWIPEGFELQRIFVSSNSIEFLFRSAEAIIYDANEISDESHVRISENVIQASFRWWRSVPGSSWLSNEHDWTQPFMSLGLTAVDGVGDMYYYDNNSIHIDFGNYVTRTFMWLYDGHFFNLSLPLRTINDNAFSEEFYVSDEIHEKIAFSAHKVILE